MSSSELDGTKTLGQLKDAFVRFFAGTEDDFAYVNKHSILPV